MLIFSHAVLLVLCNQCLKCPNTSTNRLKPSKSALFTR
uniref:Uncharacterized protein n=1 Tax=Anguilla anguilla TaxID=7936 RepID=A0A0E9XYZ1_ANGAN